MSYKLETQGAFFIVTDTLTSVEQIREPRDKVKFKVEGSEYTFYHNIPSQNLTGKDQGIGFDVTAFDFADIVDSGGTPFVSETALRQWLSSNIGYLCCETITSNTTNAASGLYSGGQITINGVDNTLIDIAAGSAIICDYWTTPGTIYKYSFSWTAQSGVTVDNLLTSTQSYIAIDKLGNITQYPSRPTNTERRDVVFLAQLGHANLTNVASVNDYTSIYDSPHETVRDVIWELRLINDGVTVSPNGANLNINRSAGSIFGMGLNWENDIRNPNKVDISSGTVVQFRYRTQTGGNTGTVSLIDPTKYDNGGTITNVPAGGTKTTNQRVYQFPNGNIVIQYGQQVYDTLSAAIQGLNSESFIIFDNVAEGAILIGIISVTRGATALNNSTQARFIPVSKFGETIGGAAGISVTNLQQAYDNSSTPEILTDSTRGAVSIKRGSAADTDDVFEIIDGSNVVKAFIKGNGTAGVAGPLTIGAYTLPATDGTAGQVLQTDGAGVATWQTVGGGLTIGTTAIAGGTVGRILFEGSGNVVQQDSTLFWNNINKRLGIGATPDASTRLDVRAQGALSTDIVQRWRNSADSSNLLSINGVGYIDGTAVVSGTGDKNIFQTRASYNSANQNIGWRLDVTPGSNQWAHIEVDKTRITQFGGGMSGIFGYVTIANASTYFKGQADSYNGIDYHWGNSGAVIGYYNILAATAGARLDSRFWSWNKKAEASQPTTPGSINLTSLTELMRLECKGGNLLLGGTTFGTNATRTFGVFSGVAPTTTVADMFQMYSADQGGVAGRAAVHFLSEEGTVNSLGYFNGFGWASGTALGARVDILAQGALSTDLAFRIRNSANTFNLLNVAGNGTVWANGAGGSIYNTCFGEEALDANTTGIFNSAFGWQALTSVTTGNYNTAVGLQALKAVVSGSGNTAIGDEAGESITGGENVAVGRYSMQSAGSGGYNTCIGGNTGLNISTGENNFFGGFNCGATGVITGAHNIGIGSQGLTNLTSGGYNIGIGYLAGGNVSTGTYNTFLGANAGLGITTGAKNTFIGNVSGLAGSTASNVIIADGDGNRLIRKDANHNQILGPETALATTATDGFTYIPTCAGTPTGTPTAITGKVPIVADTTNNKLYVYLGGAWVAMN